MNKSPKFTPTDELRESLNKLRLAEVSEAPAHMRLAFKEIADDIEVELTERMKGIIKLQ